MDTDMTPPNDPYTDAWQLCDNDGTVRTGAHHHGTDYPCTGSAHIATPAGRYHIRCTNPVHVQEFNPSPGPWYPATLAFPVTDRPIDLNDHAQTPTQPRAHLAWMRKQLAQCTYKPNWDMTIQTDDTLIIRYHAVDSRNPGLPKRFEAHRALTPTGDPNTFHTEILNHLDDIEKHETREWFRVDGKLFADPHTDPTRWHCTNCGGVGPTRHEGNTWRCPGCGWLEEQTGQHQESPRAGLGSPTRAQDVDLVSALRRAVHDPGAVVGRRLDPSWGEGEDGFSEEPESLWDWIVRALTVTVANLDAPAAAPRAEPVDGEQAPPADSHSALGALVSHLDTMLIEKTDDDETYWATKEALRTEMAARRERPAETDPLIKQIDLYADLRRIAAGESDSGFELVEARAELVRDDIAGTIRATQGQIRRIVQRHDELRTEMTLLRGQVTTLLGLCDGITRMADYNPSNASVTVASILKTFAGFDHPSTSERDA